MKLLQELSATWLDILALVLFTGGWFGYAIFAERHGRKVPNLHNTMDSYRREWMVRMIERDNRMTDVNIMRTLTRSSQFFASTTILVLGALIALTGYVQQTLDVVSGLPFTMKASARLLEIKIGRSEEHTSELQSQSNLVCRLLLEKKKRSEHSHDRNLHV